MKVILYRNVSNDIFSVLLLRQQKFHPSYVDMPVNLFLHPTAEESRIISR
jgi:hypothetical protein